VYINDHEKENVRIDTPHVMINWTAFPERNPVAKEKIAVELTERMAEITGADKSRIVVIFNDFPPTDGLVGGIPRSVKR
jgi:phenylpyruvate tautomerase PptA (4-oxalocrotonate tautomerase family)